MQVPPVIPKVNAPSPNELTPEPVQRVAPVVMNDAANRPDPSVILKTPVPVSQGPRDTNRARQALDQTGPVHVTAQEAEESESSQHLSRLAMALERAESGPHAVKWPLPRQAREHAPQHTTGQRQSAEPPLAQSPQQAMAVLRQGLAQSPMLAASVAAEGLGLVKSKTPKQHSQATLLQALSQLAEKDSADLRDGVTLLMHGQLMWQGEFTHGVNGRIVRDNAYSKDPRNPGGPVVKGTQIQIELELPNLGRVTLRGLQVEDQVSLYLRPDRTNGRTFSENFSDLKAQMAKAKLQDVNLWFQQA